MALRLATVHRWAVTGTPMGRGGVDDLATLALFVGQEPLAHPGRVHVLADAAERLGPARWHSTPAYTD
jgi:hypothetical protein